MSNPEVIHGDCLDVLPTLTQNAAELIYLDPPFFTQKTHKLGTRDGVKNFSFEDIWGDYGQYMTYMSDRLEKCRNVLSDTGSIFVHCDRNSSHLLRLVCDKVFGSENFKSEIIWHYKRWSNSANALLPAHQNILYYTKTKDFTFNKKFVGYSESTNVDQILQKRSRDDRNKSVYSRDDAGNVLVAAEKKGVPLSDVWEIPYLNPKAKERVGYPTQKPILLLERIIELSTNEGDLVIDPFCGSGTTLVAAKLLNRKCLGIDTNEDAVELTANRLLSPAKTQSALLEKGRASYSTADTRISQVLAGIKYTAVQRNSGIDAILLDKWNESFVFVRLQKQNESIKLGIEKLQKAADKRGGGYMIFVASEPLDAEVEACKDLLVVEAQSQKILHWLATRADVYERAG
ncbi:site-specific DNA-methyltransferase [Ruegeria arenilitoris]|uniref:site-specific DNA-methyltransferase n=1 Tax=Ruegeria arenilitoris TaxID=1173585 RepID=UPI00147CEBCF|nr:site-specific DNA-methyltransferase [Ruegeria arenilitoris]